MQDEMLVEGFLSGVKECILIDDTQLAQKLINKRIPRKTYKRRFMDRHVNDYWFFKNQNVKREFLEMNIHNKLKNGIFDHLSMGKILGFPPKAIEMFSSGLFESSDRIGMDYCGMYFMSYKQTIVEDLSWLFENRFLPLGKGFEIVIEFHDTKKSLRYDVDEYCEHKFKIIADVNSNLRDTNRLNDIA